MQDNNPTIIPNPQVPQPQVAKDAENLQRKIRNLIDNLKVKFNSSSKNTKIVIILIASLFLIIVLLSILVGLFGKKQNYPVRVPTPSPISASAAPQVILNASRYATDSGVLKIESDLENIEKQLESTDVKQMDLNLPNLDFNISFNN